MSISIIWNVVDAVAAECQQKPCQPPLSVKKSSLDCCSTSPSPGVLPPSPRAGACDVCCVAPMSSIWSSRQISPVTLEPLLSSNHLLCRVLLPLSWARSTTALPTSGSSSAPSG